MRPFPSRFPFTARRFATELGSFRKTPNAPVAALPFARETANDAGRVKLRTAVTGPVYVTTVPFFSVYDGPAGRGRGVAGTGVAGASVGSGVGSGVGAAVGAVDATGAGLSATPPDGTGVALGFMSPGAATATPPMRAISTTPAMSMGSGFRFFVLVDCRAIAASGTR